MSDTDDSVGSETLTDQPIPEVAAWVAENSTKRISDRTARLARKRLTRTEQAEFRRWVAYRTLARHRRSVLASGEPSSDPAPDGTI